MVLTNARNLPLLALLNSTGVVAFGDAGGGNDLASGEAAPVVRVVGAPLVLRDERAGLASVGFLGRACEPAEFGGVGGDGFGYGFHGAIGCVCAVN